MDDVLYNGNELLLTVYLVLWDSFDVTAVFRNELEAEEFVSKRAFPSMHEIKESKVR